MNHLPIPSSARQLEWRQDAEYLALSEPASGQESSFHDYLGIFKRRKWWIIVPFVLVTALGLLQIAFEGPVYTATTTLLINDVKPQIVPVQDFVPAENSPDFYNTQYQIIKSRAIIGKLVDTLHLDAQPLAEPSPVEQALSAIRQAPRRLFKDMVYAVQGFLGAPQDPPQSESPVADPVARHRLEAIVRVQENLQVSPREETKIVDLTLQGSDPVAVVEQVNTLADIYIRENLESKLEASRQAIAWLREESATLRQKTEQAALTMEDFKDGKDYLLAGADGLQRSTAQQRLDRLNASYVETNTARLQLETQLEELRKVSKRSIPEMLKFPEVAQNPFITSLKSKFFDLQLEYTNLAKLFGPKHPKMIQAKAALAEVRRAISTEVQNMISSTAKEYQTLLAKEARLKNELETQKAEIFGFGDDIRQYNALQRDLEIDQNLHQIVSKRLAEATLTEALTTNNIRVIERALESEPVSQTAKTMALNLFLGLTLGVGLGFIVEYLDKRFKSADEVEQYLGLPCLGTIPHYPGIRHGRKPIALQDAGSSIAEAYRSLRTWVQASAAAPVKSLLITSATPAEGKSTTAANLAVSFAQLGRRVLLVDVDLRRPALHRAFGLTNDAGLTDVLVRGTDWRQVLQRTDLDNLQLLPAGFIPSNPVELLSTQRLQTLIAQAKHDFDLVIFDAPMVLSLPDVATLAPTMDGVVLVHHPTHRGKDVILQAKRLLVRLGAPLLGVVLNNVRKKKLGYYTQHHYEYYQTSASGGAKPGHASAVRYIDMPSRPVEANWAPVPATAIYRTDTSAMPLGKTARSGGLACTLLAARLQQHLAGADSPPEAGFLILEVEIANETAISHTFDGERTSISLPHQDEYSRALTSLIAVPHQSESEESFPPEPQVYTYDPLTTGKLAGGLTGAVAIAAKSTKRGCLVYQIPLEADHYVFTYDSGEVTISIPFRHP
jgi:succinoglycan biosynthesis transport protein ExoP